MLTKLMGPRGGGLCSVCDFLLISRFPFFAHHKEDFLVNLSVQFDSIDAFKPAEDSLKSKISRGS